VIDGLNSVADGYLGKPFEPQEHQNVGRFDCDADRPNTDRTTSDIRRAGLRSFFDRC
jgi:DNA-binding response OmpR family regulator